MSMGSMKLSYSEKREMGSFKINDSGYIDSFNNAWEQTRIKESPRTEERELAKTTKLNQDALILANPDKERAINKYGAYVPPSAKEGGTAWDSIQYLSNFSYRLQRERYARYFNNGKVYMDESGRIKSNVPELDKEMEEDQEDLKMYWDYRQLTDGTQYDMATLDAQNVTRMQNELMRLQEAQRGATGFLAGAGEFMGTMGFIMSEPEIIMSMAGSTGNVGAGLLKNAGTAFAKEAGLSAVADGVMKYQVHEWRRKLYDPSKGIEAYTTMDAIKDISIDAMFAGTLQGVGSGFQDLSSISRLGGKGGTVKARYAKGKRKFDIIDGKGKKSKWGSEGWREDIRKTMKKDVARHSADGKAKADDVVNDAVDIIDGSPRGDIAKHVDDVAKAQEHIEAGTRFPNEDLHVKIDDAQSGDFISIKDNDGQSFLVRVEDADADTLIFADVDGNPVMINRLDNTIDSDRWSVSETPDTLSSGGKVESVNDKSIDDILKRDDAEQELIASHAEDEEILRYNKGEEDTIQEMIDIGCLDANYAKGSK